MSALQPMTALAGGGTEKAGVGGAPANDLTETVITPELAAGYAEKLSVANGVQDYLRAAASGTQAGPTPNIICPDGCGGTGTAPPVTKILATKPRQQSTWYWCGPASGQVVINWSRGFAFADVDGDSTTTNYKKQATLASWMGTTTSKGTYGGTLAAVLNRDDAVDPPTATWAYIYKPIGTMLEYHSKIVSDVAKYGMPLVAGVAPHIAGSDFPLQSWGTYTGNAHHYIVLSGYSGLIPTTATITYDDSSKGFSGGTGEYEDSMTTIWNVTKNNQGYVIW